MIDLIKAHLDSLFAGAPRTRKVEDMYQELLAGCLDKYSDLTAGGMDEEEAYKTVIEGIGDVGELLAYAERAEAFDPADAAVKRRKRAFLTSAGIFGYFIAAAAYMYTSSYGDHNAAIAAAVFIAGIATAAIIYGRLKDAYVYEKAADTLVEELKVAMASGSKADRFASLAASSLWSITIMVYLAVSFFTGGWHLTWMIFLLAVAVQAMLLAYSYPAARNKYLSGAYWSLAVLAYMIVSFLSQAWHITWLVFPCALAAYQALRLYKYWKEEK